MEILCDYYFEIKYIQGKENKVEYALTRKMNLMHIAISTNTSYLNYRIKGQNNTKEFFQKVKAGLQHHGTTHNFGHYKMEDGILKYKNMVYIPNSKNVKKLVLKEMHDVSYASHYDFQKTITRVKKDYYWQEIKKEIANYIPR